VKKVKKMKIVFCDFYGKTIFTFFIFFTR